ncbi:MAG TPA: tRNA dihydrouridine synthase DusB [Wenzhouxiangella sp.]
MRIGPHTLSSNIGLAPMAGVTDKPFRLLCKAMGAGLATSEMTTSDASLWHTKKSRHRMDHAGEPGIISVQIAGTEPEPMAQAARFNVDQGAHIIDINMGCPAKKVCKAWAGSALMQDEPRVAAIIKAVVEAVDVPVTLKIRTGWASDQKNAPIIARMAEDLGIQALAIHGRTRDQKYTGDAEYDTIAQIKSSIGIPVWANGDIDTPEKAQAVLTHTQADGLLIGRAAQGRPWIFRHLLHYLKTGQHLPDPDPVEVGDILMGHLRALYDFYGEETGVRVARKHLGWYAKDRPENRAFLSVVNQAQDAATQLELTEKYFQAMSAYRCVS